MQSESYFWDMERVCLRRTRLSRHREEAEREILFYSTLFYYITRYLCGGQHCVFIQAEDSIGHYGLVGQETTAHHLQRGKHRAQRVKNTPFK